MVKKRLIPKLLLGRSSFSPSRLVLITTSQFSQPTEVGDPISQAKIYEAQAADELIFLDRDALGEHRAPLIDIIRTAAEEIFMPFTVGGGIRTIEDVTVLLKNGADKVALNSAAVERPEFISEVASRFGAQAVVLSIDYKYDERGEPVVYSHGGTLASSRHPIAWAIEGVTRGAGEILLTCIDRDGTRTGLDIPLTQLLVQSVPVPVITSGGCGTTSHFVDAFQATNVSAVAAGTYFSFKDENPMQTRSQIRNAGISIRLHT